MILIFFKVLLEAPEAFFILMAALTVSILGGLVFHEVAHAYVADSLGDRTARSFGRLTLDPRPHLHPIGTILIFVVGFGFARPVPVNARNLRNPRRGMLLVSVAGAATNLLIAALAGLPIRLGWVPFFHPFVGSSNADFWAQIWTQSPENLLGLFLGTIVLLNVILGVFNLLPIPPLDGFRAALSILPPELSREFAKLEPWGFGVLLLLIFVPIGGSSLLFEVMGPPRDFLIELFAGDTQVRVV